MSFNGDINYYNRWAEFTFYSTENGTNGSVQQSLNASDLGRAKRFSLKELRMHWSVPFTSIEYLKVYVSSINGSNFNYVILSQLMSDIQDYRTTWASGEEFTLYSDDHVVFEMSCGSANNYYGLEIMGWTIEG